MAATAQPTLCRKFWFFIVLWSALQQPDIRHEAAATQVEKQMLLTQPRALHTGHPHDAVCCVYQQCMRSTCAQLSEHLCCKSPNTCCYQSSSAGSSGALTHTVLIFCGRHTPATCMRNDSKEFPKNSEPPGISKVRCCQVPALLEELLVRMLKQEACTRIAHITFLQTPPP